MFIILSISILSYGFSSNVFADSHNIPPISAKAELPTYENGDRVYVDGSIRDYDVDLHANTALTYRITDPSGNIVTIGQVVPDTDGNFNFDFVSGGSLFKDNGDYSIELFFGAMKGETSIIYLGGDFQVPPVGDRGLHRDQPGAEGGRLRDLPVPGDPRGGLQPQDRAVQHDGAGFLPRQEFSRHLSPRASAQHSIDGRPLQEERRPGRPRVGPIGTHHSGRARG